MDIEKLLMQCCGSERFEPMEALSRGTLYPGLDLPLFNNYHVNGVPITPLGELQALDFCIVELGEYLDTHPADRESAELYHALQASYRAKREAYVKRHGPLSKKDVTDCASEYGWACDPWPWDYTGKRGI